MNRRIGGVQRVFVDAAPSLHDENRRVRRFDVHVLAGLVDEDVGVGEPCLDIAAGTGDDDAAVPVLDVQLGPVRDGDTEPLPALAALDGELELPGVLLERRVAIIKYDVRPLHPAHEDARVLSAYRNRANSRGAATPVEVAVGGSAGSRARGKHKQDERKRYPNQTVHWL